MIEDRLSGMLFLLGISLLVFLLAHCKVAVDEESDGLVNDVGIFTLVRNLLNDLDVRQLLRVTPDLVQGVVRLVRSRIIQPSDLSLL